MPFPFLLRKDAVTRLEMPGVPLGLLEGSSYQELHFRLDPGDMLILASDGVMDAVNLKGEFYDLDRFTGSVRRHSEIRNVVEFLKEVYADLLRFIGSPELSDDVTLIALRRKQ
jgi:phosphoserine phosphatase RsbU/P